MTARLKWTRMYMELSYLALVTNLKYVEVDHWDLDTFLFCCLPMLRRYCKSSNKDHLYRKDNSIIRPSVVTNCHKGPTTILCKEAASLLRPLGGSSIYSTTSFNRISIIRIFPSTGHSAIVPFCPYVWTGDPNTGSNYKLYKFAPTLTTQNMIHPRRWRKLTGGVGEGRSSTWLMSPFEKKV